MIKAIFVDCGGTLFFVNGNNEPLLDFIRRHQNKYRFCIISDTTLDLEPSLHFFKIRDLFELVLTSGTTGFSKDKPEIYQLALNILKIKSEDVFFIDDHEEFLSVAKTLGIQTILYTTPETLARDLKTMTGE